MVSMREKWKESGDSCSLIDADVLKYYGYDLGAQTNYDAKTGTCIVNGAHDNNKVRTVQEGVRHAEVGL